VEMWMVAKKTGTIGKGAQKHTSPTGLKKIHDEMIKDENFVVEDENVATHLVRNAFGGGDHETLLGLTGLQAPLSRDGRDDITVQVIFFEQNALEW
jgi:pyruvate dehydrogenase phosphatase